jgi:hypothetical protein
MRTLLAVLAIFWALPWTLLGLSIGALGLLTGGSAQRTGRVIEFWGGWAAAFLRVFPLISGAAAVTFGHVVLAQTKELLDDCRAHELVHVRQYERWGPLFVPAYLFHWVRLWIVGRDPYLENPFERQAQDESG